VTKRARALYRNRAQPEPVAGTGRPTPEPVAGTGRVLVTLELSVPRRRRSPVRRNSPSTYDLDMLRLEIAGIFVTAAALCLLAGLVRRSSTLRRVATLIVMAGLLGFVGLQMAAPDPIASPWLPRQLPLVMFAGLAATYGIARRRAWGRWFALGAGWAGVIGFSVLGYVLSTSVPKPQPIELLAWRTAIFLAGSILVVANLSGDMMRASFGGAAFWNLRGSRIGLLRGSAFLALASIPYLLMIGLGNQRPWSVTPDRVLAFADAAIMLAGAILLIRQRTFGSVILLVGAFGVCWLWTYIGSTPWWFALAPAVLSPVLGIVALASPAWHRLRQVN
jgi:hypothetical protein